MAGTQWSSNLVIQIFNRMPRRWMAFDLVRYNQKWFENCVTSGLRTRGRLLKAQKPARDGNSLPARTL
uniref:Uncharacterized protein n=1 Tax=Hyaloperonospora arabidopsidis (strain Emoy2) TaxID=559515 RepID=M4C1B5_HYAAE